MQLDLTDKEMQLLIPLLRRAIDEERYPMAPCLDPLKAILAKLDPAKLAEPLPPPGGAGPTRGRYLRRH